MTVTNWRCKGPRFYRNLCLGRLAWETYPQGRECSHEVSIRLLWELRDLWVGLFWQNDEYERWVFYFILIPTLVLRVKFRRSWGGRFG